MIRKILIGLAIVGMFVLSLLLTRYFYETKQIQVTQDTDVVLEKVKTVAKLISVEGYFSEVYDYKDYWGYDFSLFRKKALVRVKAKVSVGYDLGELKIEAKPEEKVILVSNLPEPEILSIDHELDYYDISEGTFNYFSEKDYNYINASAKKYIEAKAQESELMQTARQEGNQALELMKFIAESAGWQFVVREQGSLDNLLN